MSLGWIIYLAGLADSLSIGAGILLFILGAAIIISFLFFLTMEFENFSNYKKYYINIAKWFIGLLIFISLLPSSNTIYLILAINVSENVIENVYDSEMYDDAIDILSLKLKDIKQELTEESE